MDDAELLREYADRNSEQAFRELVERHTDFVYSVALRQARNAPLAEEVTQAVFIALAQKARKVAKEAVVMGWLFRATQFAAMNAIRTECRRQHLMQEAARMENSNQTSDAGEVWEQIVPILNEAMSQLGERDRDALLLRYFRNKNLREVGSALGTSEDAAKMRVGRALEKLRSILARRGVATPAAALALAISTNAVQAAPAGLSSGVAAAAALKGATASNSTLTLMKGALKLMAWTKAKSVAVVGIGLLLATGTTTVAVKEISHLRTESVFNRFYNRQYMEFSLLDDAPPALAIRQTKSPFPMWDISGSGKHGVNKILELGQPLGAMLADAYDIGQYRIVADTPVPPGRYDFIASLPGDNAKALQQEIKNKFGLVGRRETRDTDVLVLKVQNRNAPGLRPSTSQGTTETWNENDKDKDIRGTGLPVDSVIGILEESLNAPVVDQSGLTGRFDLQLKYNWTVPGKEHQIDRDDFRQAVLDQLGLELVPSVQPLEVLVVEKAK
ncbi:MAG TPA: TIGR03435 family protein [Verrucomicrobiae bacterium]|nr:TIGR03435 family protein [Verrucomicrobiae bacterium]